MASTASAASAWAWPVAHFDFVLPALSLVHVNEWIEIAFELMHDKTDACYVISCEINSWHWYDRVSRCFDVYFNTFEFIGFLMNHHLSQARCDDEKSKRKHFYICNMRPQTFIQDKKRFYFYSTDQSVIECTRLPSFNSLCQYKWRHQRID